MAIGTVTIGVTPCCGAIERTYGYWTEGDSPTGMWHTPGMFAGQQQDSRIGGPYAPQFADLDDELRRGICPDCGKPIAANRA